MAETYSPEEMLTVLCARQVRPNDRVGVGVASPIATAGAMLAGLMGIPGVRFAGHGLAKAYFRGSHEASGFAQAGRMDVFFLSAAQIDARANINLQYVGDPERPKKRFPGAFAAPIYYYVMGRTVLFRERHDPRILVDKVDYVTAAGHGTPRHARRGWPARLLTPLCVFSFNREKGLLELESVHPGQTVESVQAQTGFPLIPAEGFHETAAPTARELDLLRGPVSERMKAIFP